MSVRGVRLIKALETYNKRKPNQFDTSVILSKVKIQSIADDGTSISTFTVDESMCNGGDTLHGGFIAACVDTLATFAHMGYTGKLAWTMNLNVDFVSAARIGEQVTAVTSPLRIGALPLIEAKLSSSQGRLLARGAATMLDGATRYQEQIKHVYGFDPKDD